MIAYEVSKAALNRLTVATASARPGRGALQRRAARTDRHPDGCRRDRRTRWPHLSAQRAARNAMIPLRADGQRLGLANAALFLASDEADSSPACCFGRRGMRCGSVVEQPHAICTLGRMKAFIPACC